MFRSKRDFFQAWSRGTLGNRLRVWSTPDEVPPEYKGRIMLRPINAPGGSAVLLEMPTRKAVAFWKKYDAEGRRPQWSANETAPDDKAMIQGEVFRSAEGLSLFASVRRPEDAGRMIRMREALQTAAQYSGLTARVLLRKYLSGPSYDDLQELLDLYDGHVVEFSAYDCYVGNCSGRNTIIWEVRRY